MILVPTMAILKMTVLVQVLVIATEMAMIRRVILNMKTIAIMMLRTNIKQFCLSHANTTAKMIVAIIQVNTSKQ